MAVFSIFSSTCSCESLFSVTNFVKSNYNSSLNEEASAACIDLKTTKYKPDIKYVILGTAASLTDSKIYLLFLDFYVLQHEPRLITDTLLLSQ
jgi:hypothetical protein